MLTDRERAIRDFLMDQVGGRPSFVDARKGSDAIDTDYLEMAPCSQFLVPAWLKQVAAFVAYIT